MVEALQRMVPGSRVWSGTARGWYDESLTPRATNLVTMLDVTATTRTAMNIETVFVVSSAASSTEVHIQLTPSNLQGACRKPKLHLPPKSKAALSSVCIGSIHFEIVAIRTLIRVSSTNKATRNRRRSTRAEAVSNFGGLESCPLC